MLQIDTTNRIIIDGKVVGLSLVQRNDGTVIYTPENRLAGQPYQEHAMPHGRYSTAHDTPASGVAGKSQLEADILKLLAKFVE